MSLNVELHEEITTYFYAHQGIWLHGGHFSNELIKPLSLEFLLMHIDGHQVLFCSLIQKLATLILILETLMCTPVKFLRCFRFVCKSCPIFFRCALKYVLCKYIYVCVCVCVFLDVEHLLSVVTFLCICETLHYQLQLKCISLNRFFCLGNYEENCLLLLCLLWC